MDKSTERGAAAVEFALLAPVLFMLLLGIMEFGRAYNVQVTLTNAAREGVRTMAINNDQASARNATKSAADAISPKLKDSDIAFAFQDVPATTPAPTSCLAGRQVSVTISYSLSTMTGIAGPFGMTGKGTMLCGG
ncbi:Flp pilus assembly protein TadG [Arthrobacter pascens]|uniref:TadE/TadG family type IV pilus assembly protein n=1 Tax=Arthrobacter pascens TaxID=1677 RepID=UPI0028600F40|nr:TadE/TadG family type IV pilus assembly protein [Arthrobacter pascens]MDR6556011.1 Flp pilus assembly protein TadG [Arthrobacter pascens]